jgi:hypothetical protein
VQAHQPSWRSGARAISQLLLPLYPPRLRAGRRKKGRVADAGAPSGLQEVGEGRVGGAQPGPGLCEPAGVDECG